MFIIIFYVVNTLNNNLGGYSFGTTADGQPGYRKPGADTVTPFRSAYVHKTVKAGTYKALKDGTAYLYFSTYGTSGAYDGATFTSTGSIKRIEYHSYAGTQSWLYQCDLKSEQTVTANRTSYSTDGNGVLIYPDGMF